MSKPPLDIPAETVQKAIEDAGGNQQIAAETLGVTRGWIAKWLKRRANEPLDIPAETVLKALEDADGNQRIAGEALGLTQAWVANWLKRNGYIRVITWVKKGAIDD